MEKKETKELNYLAPCAKVILVESAAMLCTSNERVRETEDSEW